MEQPDNFPIDDDIFDNKSFENGLGGPDDELTIELEKCQNVEFEDDDGEID